MEGVIEVLWKGGGVESGDCSGPKEQGAGWVLMRSIKVKHAGSL